jgi:FMN phosphatase YigB (HAD superfamily)
MISFVYFDLGGVVVRDLYEANKWIDMKRDIGINVENDKEFDQFWKKHEKEVCVAGRDVDTLIPLIENKFHLSFPGGFSLLTDFVNRFEPNKSIWPVIDKIRQDCRVGLLTNMYPRMFSAIIEKRITPPITWDVIIDSSIEGCRKPDSDIFKLGEQKANVKKDNILFVDNEIKNINAAKDFGWQTFFYNSGNHEKSCFDLLRYYNQIK